jgi:hypothetical protein
MRSRPAARHSVSPRQVEPDLHRDLDLGGRHTRRKRRQLRPAQHLIDAGVEIGVSGARKQGVIEHADGAVDPGA